MRRAAPPLADSSQVKTRSLVQCAVCAHEGSRLLAARQAGQAVGCGHMPASSRAAPYESTAAAAEPPLRIRRCGAARQ